MADDLTLKVVTPFGIIYENKVRSCAVPGHLGQFQVLRNHAPMISLINIGRIRIEEDGGKEKLVSTSGGYFEVRDNQIKVIVESAEDANKIDVERAKAAKERAEKRIASDDKDVDIDRARYALARAINRMKTARLK